jgi:ABC-type polysaccharide/polyol phosphate export permease
MQALPEVWVHRRPRGVTYGSLDERVSARAPRDTHWLHVLVVLTRNEFRARYRSQALGIVWSLLNPLVQMTILSAIFSQIATFREIPNYPVYLILGVVVWQWFSTAINAGTQSVITHADIIKRTVFPRHLLPLATALSYGVNFAMESLLVVLLALIWPTAFKLTPALLLVPIILVVLATLIASIVVATSMLNVIYRDVSFLVSTALTLLYWLTPIIYPVSIVTHTRVPLALYLMNPIAAVLVGLRDCVLSGTAPSLLTWIGMVGPTALVVLVAALVFRHYERMVLDYV